MLCPSRTCSVLGDILSPCGNTIRGLSNSTASSVGLVKNADSDAMDLGRGLRAHTHNYTAGGPQGVATSYLTALLSFWDKSGTACAHTRQLPSPSGHFLAHWSSQCQQPERNLRAEESQTPASWRPTGNSKLPAGFVKDVISPGEAH